MPRFSLSANFNVEASSAEEAEEMFEDYLADTTILTDSKSVAFNCIEAVMSEAEAEAEDEEAFYIRQNHYHAASQADGYAEGPDAILREEAA